MAATPQDVITFWRMAGPQKWFAKSAAFDEAIRLRFEPVHHAAARGAYDAWGVTPDGSLALLLLLDQFPRNLYRDSGHAFATDGKARAICKAALAARHDAEFEGPLRGFFYLPLEHSEDIADQDDCVARYEALGDPETLKWAILHRDIIARFGRFPHRNAALGRETTPQEQVFLDDGGFGG